MLRELQNKDNEIARIWRIRHAASISVFTVFALGALIFAGCSHAVEQPVQADPASHDATANEPAAPALNPPAEIRIPRGTVISVRLLSTISSGSAYAGEESDAELAAPLVVDGSTLYDKSTHARIRVMSAHASGRLHNPGFLRITLDAIKRPDGNWDYIETDAHSIKGRSHEKHNTTLIAGGAAVGAAIGAIAGGGKGAAVGAVSGAGVGTAGAYATGEKDVAFSSEQVLRFRTVKGVIGNQ
ncbi:MAG: hypothetical protein ABSH28_07775 [Acidobacteriota bacterium]|jgi:hypothetical protein